MVALSIVREGACFHVTPVAFNGRAEERSRIAILANEFRGRGEAEVDEVVEDEDLAIAVGSGANSDGGDADFSGDAGRDLPGYALEDQQNGSGGFERVRVVEKGAR